MSSSWHNQEFLADRFQNCEIYLHFSFSYIPHTMHSLSQHQFLGNKFFFLNIICLLWATSYTIWKHDQNSYIYEYFFDCLQKEGLTVIVSDCPEIAKENILLVWIYLVLFIWA